MIRFIMITTLVKISRLELYSAASRRFTRAKALLTLHFNCESTSVLTFTPYVPRGLSLDSPDIVGDSGEENVIRTMYRQFGNASFLEAKSKNCEKRLFASFHLVCPSIRPPVRMEHFGFHRMDCHGILYLGIFPKSIEIIIDSLKSDKNNGYYT